MNQQYPQLDPKTIEALKAARDQVVQADKGESAVKSMTGGQNPSLKQVLHQSPAPARPASRSEAGEQVRYGGAGKHGTGQAPYNRLAPLEARPAESGTAAPTERRSLPLTGFAEEFVQKLASIEQKTAAVDEEMAKVEKFWANLVEKKKQLEARRNELIKVKDKLKELDKEMSEVLKSQ